MQANTARSRIATNFPRLAGKPVDYEAVKRRGFLDQGMLVVSLDDPRLGWHEREMLKQIGRKLFGTAR